jgi:hypothetical protein
MEHSSELLSHLICNTTQAVLKKLYLTLFVTINYELL